MKAYKVNSHPHNYPFTERVDVVETVSEYTDSRGQKYYICRNTHLGGYEMVFEGLIFFDLEKVKEYLMKNVNRMEERLGKWKAYLAAWPEPSEYSNPEKWEEYNGINRTHIESSYILGVPYLSAKEQ